MNVSSGPAGTRSRRARSTIRPAPSRRRGRGRRSRGRWRAASRAHSAARRSTARGSGSRSASRSCSASSTGVDCISVRNVDLLVLLSFTASLWFFNRGHVFAAMSLAYPPLFWLLLRCIWIGRGDRPSRGEPVWPVWVLVAATVFLAGFRVGLNVRASNVIDVGYSGVIGADRIVHGQSPYGHFPVEDDLKRAAPQMRTARSATASRRTGAARRANPLGDTYGPVSYLAYIPGLRHLRVERQMGLAARGALHVDSLRPAGAARARARRPPSRRPSTRGRRSRLPGRRGRSRSTRRARTRTTRSRPRSSSGASIG